MAGWGDDVGIDVSIRPERPEDDDAIHALTRMAFEPMWFSSGTEAPIIRALRRSGDLTLSLVAEDHGEIVGHIAFSPVTIDGVHDRWFGLGPISVHPEHQRRGIGKALVRQGLDWLRANNAAGCALIGDPEIYRRMGFMSDGLLSYGTLDRRLAQHIVLTGQLPRGELRFAPAFETTA